MPVSMVMEHLNEMMRDLRKLDDAEAKLKLKEGNYTAAQAVAIASAQRAPRRSGRLAYSIRPRASVAFAEVRSSLVYAGPIHFGWAKHNIAPDPFMFTAAEDLRDTEIPAVFEAVMARLVEIANFAK